MSTVLDFEIAAPKKTMNYFNYVVGFTTQSAPRI